MNNLDEFKDLEFDMKKLPQHQLPSNAFQNIRENLLEEADRMDKADRRFNVLKRISWAGAGVAALFLFAFLGLSMNGPMSSDKSESEFKSTDSAKSDHGENDKSPTEDNSASVLLGLGDITEMMTEQGIVFNETTPENPMELTGVQPFVFNLSKGELSVYIFANEQELENGIIEFNEKIALMNLIDYQMNSANNVLLFYTGSSTELKQKIRKGISGLVSEEGSN